METIAFRYIPTGSHEFVQHIPNLETPSQWRPLIVLDTCPGLLPQRLLATYSFARPRSWSSQVARSMFVPASTGLVPCKTIIIRYCCTVVSGTCALRPTYSHPKLTSTTPPASPSVSHSIQHAVRLSARHDVAPLVLRWLHGAGTGAARLIIPSRYKSLQVSREADSTEVERAVEAMPISSTWGRSALI